MNSFNLIDSPWIPVRWRADATGEIPALVSLQDAFVRSAEIADLDCAPHERISLTRLLVCLTHAALGAPEDSDGWEGFGADLESKVTAYLNRADIHPHFNLLGDGPRFLQRHPKASSGSKPHPFSKACFHLASGNSPKLLDHWGEEARPWKPHEVALGILCLQNFFVGGSMAAAVKGNGPSLKSLQMILLGESLRETILNNCLDQENLASSGEGLGKPTWEAPPDRQFLSRLAPLSCFLWLSDDLHFTVIEQGFQYPEFDAYRDPFATVTATVDKRKLLRAEANKGIWRDLHLMINLQKAQNQNAPLNLQAFTERCGIAKYTDFWVGELIKAKDAKINDCVESSFTAPKALFFAEGRHTYEGGVQFASTTVQGLKDAIWNYWKILTSPPGKKARKPKQIPTQSTAERHFWHALDQNHRQLIGLAGAPESRRGKPPFGDHEATDEWTLLVRKAAQDAYDAVCPRATPRQLQAYATGLRVLRKRPARQSAKKTAEA